MKSIRNPVLIGLRYRQGIVIPSEDECWRGSMTAVESPPVTRLENSPGPPRQEDHNTDTTTERKSLGTLLPRFASGTGGDVWSFPGNRYGNRAETNQLRDTTTKWCRSGN